MKSVNDYLMGSIQLLIVAYITYIFANMYLYMEIGDFLKKLLIILICVMFLKVAITKSMENLIGLLVLMLPFPVFINFGKDLDTSITLGIYLVFMVYVIRNMARKEPIFSDRPLFPVVIWIIVSYIISFSNTPWFGRENALRHMSQFVSCIILFYLVVNNIRSKREIVKIVDIIAIMCFLEALLVIYQVFFPTKSGFINFFASRVIDVTEMYEDMAENRGIRVIGTIASDYGVISGFFAMNLIIQYFRIQSLKPSAKRNLYFICILISSFALIAIGTRGGVIALLGAILVTLFMTRKYAKIARNIVLICALCIVFLGFMFFIKENIPYVANLYDRLSGTEFKEGVPDTRVEVWEIVWPIVMKHPLVGWGPQNIGKSGIERYMNPHNMYLCYLFNIGFVGTAGVVYFFGAVFWIGFSKLRIIMDHEILYVAIGLIGAFWVFIIDGITDEYQRSGTMQQFVWIIFGLIVAVAKFNKNENNENLTIHQAVR